MTTYEQTCTGWHVTGVNLGIQSMPPGYRLDRLDSGYYQWVELVDGGPDHEAEGEINWDPWACYREAWARYSS